MQSEEASTEAPGPSDVYSSITAFDKERAEPEKIRLWREAQAERLAKKGELSHAERLAKKGELSHAERLAKKGELSHAERLAKKGELSHAIKPRDWPRKVSYHTQ